jgi:hypothetical protein
MIASIDALCTIVVTIPLLEWTKLMLRSTEDELMPRLN